ncbi:hypothetical protein B0187_07010 [Haemophilus paracuniculus]|uniref:YhcH/YjgK/YiaL family protein n=1 Tax=Haemophilus paracuniculus TaxID=734 RepID=A0A1T0ASU4_9PAST|nr:YhcH/YjgK/YiaL family protein [Haemophilus paracuniculus]OOR99001.1 hypothetical protein B0187_07010 [Haemophilus paracuniculus]
MFFGHLSAVNLKQYPAAIQFALNYLKNTDFDQLDVGRYPLKGDRIYVQVLDLTTQPKAEILPEVHRHYLDVQYLHRGNEIIGFAPDLGNNPIAIPYSAERDILRYQSAENESDLIMQAGSFAVFFPEDIHRPACIHGEQSEIRKVVVKIAMSEIEG